MKNLYVLLLCIVGLPAISQINVVPDLSTMTKKEKDGVTFYFHKDALITWIDMKLKAEGEKQPTDELRNELATVKLDIEDEEAYLLMLEEKGENFMIYLVDAGNYKILTSFGFKKGTEVTFDGHGNIFGHAKDKYDKEHMSIFALGKHHKHPELMENILQPFIYKNIKLESKADIEVYSDIHFHHSYGYIPKGTEVEIMFEHTKTADIPGGIHGKGYYLLRTPSGVVAWAKIDKID